MTPSTLTAPQTARLVRDAAAIIDTNGWIQGHLLDREQLDSGVPADRARCCAFGALRLAARRGRWPISVADIIAELIGHWLHDTGRLRLSGGLTDFNDAPDTTAATVTSALRAFADHQAPHSA